MFEAGLTEPFLQTVGSRTLRRLEQDFASFAHPHQEHAAFGNNGGAWTTWLMLGGRGAGKTRTGAEWVRALAQGTSPYADRRYGRIALIGETLHDARAVMLEGESGLLNIGPPDGRPTWTASRKRLEWPNGVVGEVFSADDPESLRGPQFEAAWCDELAKWRYADATFDMLQFGLRLGKRPRQLITTTPRPLPLIKRLLTDPRTRVTRAPTSANRDYLSPAFFEAVVGRYAGTRMGRQELDGDLIEDRPDALWSRALIETSRVTEPPALSRIVVAIDPPGTSRKGADACGIVVTGRSERGWFYVLEDASSAGLSPSAWASKAVALYRRYNANNIVAEVNIDTGFRLAQLSTPRRLVVSVELALLLIHAVRTQPSDEQYSYEKPRFFFDGRHSFKGVFGGLPYPVFWVDMKPSPNLERTEDKLNNMTPLGTDDVLEFCEAFIKDNSSYCFMPYISDNSEPAFSRVPDHHQERLDGLRNYWESERTKREVERESFEDKEAESGVVVTNKSLEDLEAWFAKTLKGPDADPVDEKS